MSHMREEPGIFAEIRHLQNLLSESGFKGRSSRRYKVELVDPYENVFIGVRSGINDYDRSHCGYVNQDQKRAEG